ncbi:uncharacterized protein PHACADRAFT_31642 [Phanerochaete carnosa HHB-10118-sp]|uniref:Uncharacterized protein n=1 Tax=Phanerochaete carnosa (strain HHB-10118-sp) TaxID=650164 RepID=K5WNH3_PHACS|nr:uncharacterized protein PHACADRAFT_31642 [Phanerochaete carnosa HHB-10118-sp]EKM51842.1 hypothetical protein PHACADRAFT_31642 [Phanerochaete carnosa HHB-10118-sp]
MRLSTAIASTVLSFLAIGVSADLWIPPVIEPSADTVWVVGQFYNITWDNSDPPVNITDSLGHAYLVKDFLLDPNQPQIASNFPLRQGWVTVQAPDVAPADDYSILLFGDSSNFGPEFSIVSA